MLLGYPFLTTHTAHLHLPLLGDVHVASALFFDIGVFAVVVGSTLLILTALAHQSVRAYRPATRQNQPSRSRLMEEVIASPSACWPPRGVADPAPGPSR
jgi:multicomponent K+:H+ antiporter subunit A